MEVMKRILDKILYWIVVVLFALLVVVVVWQVVTRSVMQSPSTWTEEGARITFVWLGLFAAAYVFGERGHVAVEVLVRKFPEGVERIIAIIVQLLVLFFALVILVWGGYGAAQNAWMFHVSSLPLTVGQVYLALPVSGVLMAFYAIYYLVGLIRGTEAPYPDLTDEVEIDAEIPDAETRKLVNEPVGGANGDAAGKKGGDR